MPADPTTSAHPPRLRWVEPWYAGYGLAGVVVLGTGPVLIPISVDPAGARAVGLVVAAFYVGALFTPLIGGWADRTGHQRAVFLSCFPVMAVPLVLFGYAGSLQTWVPLAVLFGGAGAVATAVGGLFVVEAHPRSEWDDRISWFRLAYGAGQVLGLAIAAYAATHLLLGWWIGGALTLAGVVLGSLGLPRLGPAAPNGPRRPTGDVRILHAAHHTHHRSALRVAVTALRSRYGLFLLTWLVTMTGVQTFFNVVPLVMGDAFGVAPSVSSLLFLTGATVGALLYPAIGRLAHRVGAGAVLAVGLGTSIAAFAVMAVTAWWHPSWQAVPASLALVAAAVAYSFQFEAATLLAAELTSGSEGSAMGAMNSAIAAGAIVGALVPSVVAAAFGYGALPLMAGLILLGAVGIGFPILRRRPATQVGAR